MDWLKEIGGSWRGREAKLRLWLLWSWSSKTTPRAIYIEPVSNNLFPAQFLVNCCSGNSSVLVLYHHFPLAFFICPSHFVPSSKVCRQNRKRNSYIKPFFFPPKMKRKMKLSLENGEEEGNQIKVLRWLLAAVKVPFKRIFFFSQKRRFLYFIFYLYPLPPPLPKNKIKEY